MHQHGKRNFTISGAGTPVISDAWSLRVWYAEHGPHTATPRTSPAIVCREALTSPLEPIRTPDGHCHGERERSTLLARRSSASAMLRALQAVAGAPRTDRMPMGVRIGTYRYYAATRCDSMINGSANVNVVPRPSSLSTQIRPPWPSTICWQIARPRPRLPLVVPRCLAT